MPFLLQLNQFHKVIFCRLERALDGWFLGLSARLIFSSVLLFFFINSAMTKLGDGPLGLFEPSVGAYAQIIPPIVEAVGYDTSQIAFFPWKLIVIAGTVAEVVLPLLILLGLFSRLAALSFIGFIAVMSYVDIAFHKVEAETIGTLFDPVHNSAILDQRLLWLMPLLVLIIKGPGMISLDHLASKLLSRKQPGTAALSS
ncbi:putative oxidoreductase [Cohaesibacter sp. ES.047]|uniref:DoxX family membrane protein n=1 Tax=Cohaesibacter sp. ES.047 TaxID=1798205 RepID=UPI000BB6B5DD|nr:DoxX family membrane protein [Cohaesibacter sp. ES.047]SNY91581.1 putative oxidoreductase [Cohaesibacter sp. ES.047]